MRRHFLLLLTAVVLLGGTLNLVRRIVAPIPGDGVQWSSSAHGLLARSVAAGVEGVVPGDRLVAIDGQPIAAAIDLLLLDRESVPGAQRQYQLEREGNERVTEVTVRAGTAPRGYLLLSLAGFASLISAFRILKLASSELAAARVAAALIAFAGMALFSPCGWMDGWDRAALGADELARVLLPPLVLHAVFALGGGVLGGFAVVLWAPVLALALIDVYWLLGFVAREPADVVRMGIWIERAISLEMALGIGLAALLSIRLWLRADVVAREPLRRLVRGAALGLTPYAVFVAAPAGLGLRSPALADASLLFLPIVPFALLGVFPGARLSLRDLARNGLMLGAAVLLAFGLVLATAQLATSLLPQLGLPAWLAYACAGGLLAIGLFERLRATLQGWLEALFDRQGYEARRTLLAFGRELAVETRIDALADSLVVRVLRAFSSPRAALYAIEPGADHRESSSLRLMGMRSREREWPERLPIQAIEGLVPAAGRAIVLDDEWAEPLRRAGFGRGVPLVSRGRVCGLLVLADPGSMRFGRREQRLLADLSGYVAVALDHAALYARAFEQAQEIRELEQFRLSIIESLGIGLAIIDLDGRLLSANRAFRELLGDGSVELRAYAREVLPAELLDPPAEGQVERRTLGDRTVAVSTRLLLRAEGSVQGRILVAEDVSERVVEEAEALRREKLATVGLLAAGIAHEVNTPLAGIASYVQMLVASTGAEDPRRVLLDKVEKQSFRAAKMVRNLLNFARTSDAIDAPFRIEQVVTEALSLLEHTTRRAGARVEVEFAQELPAVMGRAGEIEQVALNLIKNASEAMPDGGELRIATGVEGGEVWLRVQDSGEGMDARVRERLFEPFFTTKERGRGHGLGLAVSHGIVEAHHGRMEIVSAPGDGTTVTLWLPAAAAVNAVGAVDMEPLASRVAARRA